MNSDWIRVSKAKPCLGCGRPSTEHTSVWCRNLRDGRGSHCMFTESKNKCGSGWMHWVDGDEKYTRQKPRIRPEEPPTKTFDFARLDECYRKAATNTRVVTLAKTLGLTFDAIRDMQWGWDGLAWTVPTRSTDGKIVGIQRRYSDGQKITEGKGGFFMPASLNGEVPLMVVEGASDTTALRGLGFGVIGTYNVGWNPEGVYRIAAGRPIVIVRDNDERAERGRIGGRIRIARFYKTLRKMKADVTMIVPPAKDARAWVNAGATREDVLELTKV